MSRIGRDKGSISIDDRIDVLAMACGYFVKQIARDQETAIKQRKNELLKKKLDSFMNHNRFRKKSNNLKWFNNRTV